jgi:hypothetical protein
VRHRRQTYETHLLVDVLLAEAGGPPMTLASGKVNRVRIRYACNHRRRATTTSWAHVLKRIDRDLTHPIPRGHGHGATYRGALRSVAATWLRVLYWCWQDNTHLRQKTDTELLDPLEPSPDRAPQPSFNAPRPPTPNEGGSSVWR